MFVTEVSPVIEHECLKDTVSVIIHPLIALSTKVMLLHG